jgi:hypothetical protein
VLLPERFPKKSAGTKQMATEAMAITQSRAWSCMSGIVYLFGVAGARAPHAVRVRSGPFS